MTDRRVTDLSYGHVGEVSYDIDESLWKFTADHIGGQTFQQLLPFTQFQPPSSQTVPKAQVKSSTLTRPQVRALVKKRPETFPANILFGRLYRETRTLLGSPETSGGLFSIGGAVDVERQPGYRTVPVIAIPHGEAGHFLRLIRPRISRYGWGRQSSIGISLLGATPLDCGHWVGTGGTIHQISFADDGNVASTWLAIRQDFETTVFRPMYDSIPQPAVVPMGYGQMYPPSRLSPNPVAALTAERTGSKRHVDVSFNPYYARQFAVVDDTGSWSIWNIEGRVRQRSSLELIPGKNGQTYDDYTHNPSLKDPDSADGWHRVLWAANVSTIVVCNRRHIAVFDIKSTPTRLHDAELLAPSSTDWIIDIKRSARSLSQLFVLTSSRLFWVEVVPSVEDKEKESGLKPILSYRHFLDSNDNSLKLTILGDTDVLVLISSSRSSLINFYNFSANSDNANTPNAYHGAFSLSTDDDSQLLPGDEALQSIYFDQSPILQSLSRAPGPEFDYAKRSIKFYQSFLFSPNHGLKVALFSVHLKGSGPLVSIPDTIVSFPSRRYKTSRRAVDDPFIVPDGALDEIPLESHGSDIPRFYGQSMSGLNVQGGLHQRINFKRVFQHIFTVSSTNSAHGAGSPTLNASISDLLERIADEIHKGKETNTLAMGPLLDLAHSNGIAEELEQAGPVIEKYLENFQAEHDPNSSHDLVLSNLTLCPGVIFSPGKDAMLSTLLEVYDRIGDLWLTSLPIQVSNLSRLTKFKSARKIATELYLASVAVSLREKGSHVIESDNTEMSTISLPILSKANEMSQSESAQYASSQIGQISSPPTPTQTPTLLSEESAPSTEATRDSAILRLRQYAVSIVQPPRMGSSSLLSLWPSSPGQDPASYSWKADHHSANDEGDQGGEAHRRRREESRRQKRTEKFLSRGTVIGSEVVSQPPSAPFGSQPMVALHTTGSQAVNELPMTQPDRGLFGSRFVQAGNKRLTKRRAAGF